MDLLLPFLTTLLITVLLTPLTILFAKKYGLIDNPKLRPHPAHITQRVVPRAGGLPIFIALFFSILFFIPLDKHILGLIFSSILLLATGLLDDALINFNPLFRLVFQVIAALIIVVSGVGIAFITNPLGGIINLNIIDIPINLIGSHHIYPIADLLALVWIVWIMNVLNWSKGVDGQMPGIALVASIIIFILSYKFFLNGDQNQYHIALLSLITAGASLGSLIFNWHPARIFPGFSGSTILGFMIASLSILSGAKLATALLVLLIPTIDFIYTFFRRLYEKKAPYLGDQKHLHHLLLKRGWSHPQISLFYIISCSLLGLAATTLSSEGKLFTALSASVVVLSLILWLQYLYRIK